MMCWPMMPALRRGLARLGVGVFSLLLGHAVHAHSSSNSYLTLSTSGPALILRADVHLRDVDLIFDLDANRDGQVTWGETQARSAELNAWLAEGMTLTAADQTCVLGTADLQASEHADGTYLSAQWAVSCPGLSRVSDVVNTRLALRYQLMFAQDSLHRGLLKVDLAGHASSAVLSPDRPQVQVSRAESGRLQAFGRYLLEGVWHIWIGIDHIVFLLSLLVLAPLQPSRQRVTQWSAAPKARPVVRDVLAVVTAFTVAHSVTLGLTITGLLTPPADVVEPAIALSVVLAALNNLLGFSALQPWCSVWCMALVLPVCCSIWVCLPVPCWRHWAVSTSVWSWGRWPSWRRFYPWPGCCATPVFTAGSWSRAALGPLWCWVCSGHCSAWAGWAEV